MSAHSDGLGQGSEFFVQIPLVAIESTEQTVNADAAACAPQRVLIIEGNVDAADTLCEVLSLGDHEVEAAYNGPDGLAKARTFKPAFVLCDRPARNGRLQALESLLAEVMTTRPPVGVTDGQVRANR